MKRVIVDTGPLVAYFDRGSEFHDWTCEQFKRLSDPLHSCQPVITETLFLLKRNGISADLPLSLVEQGELNCAFDLHSEITAVRLLLRKYRDLPATLADACLIRMSELEKEGVVFTLELD